MRTGNEHVRKKAPASKDADIVAKGHGSKPDESSPRSRAKTIGEVAVAMEKAADATRSKRDTRVLETLTKCGVSDPGSVAEFLKDDRSVIRFHRMFCGKNRLLEVTGETGGIWNVSLRPGCSTGKLTKKSLNLVRISLTTACKDKLPADCDSIFKGAKNVLPAEPPGAGTLGADTPVNSSRGKKALVRIAQDNKSQELKSLRETKVQQEKKVHQGAKSPQETKVQPEGALAKETKEVRSNLLKDFKKFIAKIPFYEHDYDLSAFEKRMGALDGVPGHLHAEFYVRLTDGVPFDRRGDREVVRFITAIARQPYRHAMDAGPERLKKLLKSDVTFRHCGVAEMVEYAKDPAHREMANEIFRQLVRTDFGGGEADALRLILTLTELPEVRLDVSDLYRLWHRFREARLSRHRQEFKLLFSQIAEVARHQMDVQTLLKIFDALLFDEWMSEVALEAIEIAASLDASALDVNRCQKIAGAFKDLPGPLAKLVDGHLRAFVERRDCITQSDFRDVAFAANAIKFVDSAWWSGTFDAAAKGLDARSLRDFYLAIVLIPGIAALSPDAWSAMQDKLLVVVEREGGMLLHYFCEELKKAGDTEFHETAEALLVATNAERGPSFYEEFNFSRGLSGPRNKGSGATSGTGIPEYRYYQSEGPRETLSGGKDPKVSAAMKYLGLNKPFDQLTKQDISRAFKVLSIVMHPDKAEQSPEAQRKATDQFQALEDARAVLFGEIDRK